MLTTRALLPTALLAVALAAPVCAQEPAASYSEPSLAAFIRDATTVTALPWQREPLGLAPDQVQTLQGIAARHRATLDDLNAEIRMLFETIDRLDRPVDAREALALYTDIVAHKAEALATFHAAAREMRDVLTPSQRTQWEADLAAAGEGYEGR